MIWFDALLEEEPLPHALERALCVLLGCTRDAFDIVDDLTALHAGLDAFCLQRRMAGGAFATMITLYAQPAKFDAARCLDIVDAAAILAHALGVRVLIADDATSNPYAFILIAGSGERARVQVDASALDERDSIVMLDR
ncbi:MAG TPA: hypothetical protein VGC55_02480 [Dokdonella sp.]